MWSRNWGKDLNASSLFGAAVGVIPGNMVGEQAEWDRDGQAGNEERVVKPITSVDNYDLTPLVSTGVNVEHRGLCFFPTRRGKKVCQLPPGIIWGAVGKGIDILVLLVTLQEQQSGLQKPEERRRQRCRRCPVELAKSSLKWVGLWLLSPHCSVPGIQALPSRNLEFAEVAVSWGYNTVSKCLGRNKSGFYGTGVMDGNTEGREWACFLEEMRLIWWGGGIRERKSRQHFPSRWTCVCKCMKVQEGILTNVLSALFFIACILFS